MRPDVDSTTSGQCAAERRAVTNGIEKAKIHPRYSGGYGVHDRSSIAPRISYQCRERERERNDRRNDRGVTRLADRTSHDADIEFEPERQRIIRGSRLQSASRDRCLGLGV